MTIADNIISGHAPGHLRDAFVEALEGSTAIDGTEADQRALRVAAGRLWNCTDILPGSDCALLDLPAGSSYAQAARAILADR